MFNKADAETFVKEEKKDIYQKIHNTVSEEELIKYKNAFENNVNRTYANMSKTIDDGLKQSVSSLMDVYNTSHSLPITTKISFFIRNISGFKAFTKIVKEYSNDYNEIKKELIRTYLQMLFLVQKMFFIVQNFQMSMMSFLMLMII